jgi:hypothetical protein
VETLRGWLLVGLVAASTIGCTASASEAEPDFTYGPHNAATDRLVSLIENVKAADGYVYDPHDDRGNGLTAAKILNAPGGGFVAVSHWPDPVTSEFVTSVSTSDDLLNWTWRAELGRMASQPTIAEASDGGYVVAWEQQPDPIHILFSYYATYDDLLAARPAKTYMPPLQLSNCAEGTPSFYSASSTHLDVGMHYYRDCRLDREAHGFTDWTSWNSRTEPGLDRAIERLGVDGGIGDRDGPFTFDGFDYMVIEGQRVLDRWDTFTTFVYDPTSGSARRLNIQTHGGSQAFSNPTVGHVRFEGREALVMSMFIPGEGSAPGEAGGVIYYRFLD